MNPTSAMIKETPKKDSRFKRVVLTSFPVEMCRQKCLENPRIARSEVNDLMTSESMDCWYDASWVNVCANKLLYP